MATNLEIKNRVLANLIDTPTAVQNDVQRIVNSVIREAQKRRNFFVMQAKTTVNTVAGTRFLLAAPADFKGFRDTPFYTTELGSHIELTLAGSRDTQRAIGPLDEGPPEIIEQADPDVQGASSYYIWPLPDGQSDYGDGEYRITIPYWRWLPKLTADGDTNWLTEYAEDWIIDMATHMGFMEDWDEERAMSWETKAMKLWPAIRRADTELWLRGHESLAPFTGGRMPRVLR